MGKKSLNKCFSAKEHFKTWLGVKMEEVNNSFLGEWNWDPGNLRDVLMA